MRGCTERATRQISPEILPFRLKESSYLFYQLTSHSGKFLRQLVAASVINLVGRLAQISLGSLNRIETLFLCTNYNKVLDL